MLSTSLHPAWPYVLAMAFMVAWAYAGFVVWRVNHPRYRRFWHSNVWYLVVGGNTLIAMTAGFIVGWDAFVGIMVLNAVWGLPMIAMVVMTNERKQAAEDEQADATR